MGRSSSAVTVAVLLSTLHITLAGPSPGVSSDSPSTDALNTASHTRAIGDGRLNLLLVAIPMSPMHSVVAIGQEMCLRGHNVTVVSLGEEGAKKARKYSPKCALNYISAGPMPLTKDEINQLMVTKIASTNSTFLQMKYAATELFPIVGGKLVDPVRALLQSGAVNPDYALLSLPAGQLAPILSAHGVEFAINIPTNLLPPISDHPAAWVPLLFYQTSVHDKRFINRLVVRTLSTVVHLARHFASGMGLIPPTAADMDPEALKGKLVLVNSIPGLDYPQPLPPLVQYTGPIIEMNTMEAFTPDVEAWMDAVPVGKPVVYVSYGTVAFLKEDQVRYMANVLTSDKFFALWALPSDQHAGLPDDLPSSVKVHHWIPTPRALAHPKVAAFVSHCGGNSVSESIAMGKPIVGYPQFGDQTANCQRVADAGAGTTAPLKQSWVKQSDILEVIQNGAYTKRAAQLARLFKAFGGTKKAADLIEVGATGDFHLMSPPTHNSFWDWFLLEGYDIKILGCLGLFMAGYMARGMSCCGGRRGRSTKLKTT